MVTSTTELALENDCAGKVSSNCKRRTRPLVRERTISSNPQLSDSNKNLYVSPRWVLHSKIDWLSDVGRNIRLRLGISSERRLEIGELGRVLEGRHSK
jgi:hypothetical protein